MAKNPTHGIGRPTIKVLTKDDEKGWSQLEALAGVQCTAEEVAAFFGVSADTLDRRVKSHTEYAGFAEYFADKKRVGKISLRRRQWTKAMEGNCSMLIWLGKQYLGQSDTPSHGESDGDIIFQSRVGPGGTVIQEIKNATPEDVKAFDAKDILNEELESKTKSTAKKKTTKKAATKKKSTTKKKEK